MKTLINGGRFQAQNDKGPIPGALLYTYGAGGPADSTNYQPTYAGDGTTNSNPVVCNQYGQASVRLDPSLSYRLVLKDTLGVTVYDEDNVTGELFNLSSASGAGTVGFNTTATYASGTLGAALLGAITQGVVNVWRFLSDIQLAQVKAGTISLDLTSAINTAKSFAGNRPLYFPAGTYAISTLSFIGNLGGIIGEGIGNTILKVTGTVTTALDLNDTTDANPRAGILKSFTLDGSGSTTNGINARYRHQIAMEDLYITGCTNGLVEKDTYLARHKNVRCVGNSFGLTLVGSNHASNFVGCTFDGNSNTQLLIQTNGTAADGNSALTFVGCDVEFGTGTSAGADITCTDVTFSGCYLGENIPGNVVITRAGIVSISGGTLFFGYTANSFGVSAVGGKTVVRGSSLAGQTNGLIAYLVGAGSSGRVAFYDCLGNFIVGGDQIINSNVLDYGPQGTVYAPRFGKGYSAITNNTTANSSLIGVSKTVTCLTAPGPTPLIGMSANLINPSTWFDGGQAYLVLVYQSSKPLNVKLSGSSFGGTPTMNIGTAPATSGAYVTYVKMDAVLTAQPYVLLELIQTSSAVGDSISILECFLSDVRMVNPAGSNLGNLYKC